MTSATDTCPIWGTPARHYPRTGDGVHVESSRTGGGYFVSGTAEELLKRADDQLRLHLTTWLVNQRALGASCPRVRAAPLDEVKNGAGSTVAGRADGVLRFLAERTESLGAPVRFRFQTRSHDRDNLTDGYFGLLAHSECVGEDDLNFLLDYLKELRWGCPVGC